MRQTTLSVPLEVKPESCSALSALIERVKVREDTGTGGIPENFGKLARAVPTLHFMSMSVFVAADYDPIFIVEANFDGAPGIFWGQIEAVLGEDFRDMLRCCKEPLDDDAELFRAVTVAGSRTPVVPYMEARTQLPSVFHHGNRGLARRRILDEQALFLSLRGELDAPTKPGAVPYHDLSPSALHDRLRAAMLMLPDHQWLNEPAPPRITSAEKFTDRLRLALFVIVVLLALSAPGLLLAALMSTLDFLVLVGLASVIVVWLIYINRRGLRGTEVATKFRLSSLVLSPKWIGRIVLFVAIYAVAATLFLYPTVLACGFILHYIDPGTHDSTNLLWPVVRVVVLGLAGLLITLPLIVLWLRHDEQHQSAQDSPSPSERAYRDMIRREDWVAQNHMGSIVLIKPGVLRAVIIRAGHLGLGLALRVIATDGYLGSMRTVHFAHWAFLNNGSRLLFFSNFDHSWGSYLDDFIEKAHPGLTLAWGCGVGFPPTRFLVYDGASHGRQFKAWALASRAVSRFWFSAYPDLTVDQIERNNRIADGLRRRTMGDRETPPWTQDL